MILTQEYPVTDLPLNQIVCGNCLEVIKDWPDKSVDLIVTSPPYNMRLRVLNGRYVEREKTQHFSKKYNYYDDALSIEEYYQFHFRALEEFLRVAKVIFGNIQIVTGSKEAVFKVIGAFNKQIRDIIVWDKGFGQPAMHDRVLNCCYELILVLDEGVCGREI